MIGDDAIHGESAYTFGDITHTHALTLHGHEPSRKLTDIEAGTPETGEASKAAKQA